MTVSAATKTKRMEQKTDDLLGKNPSRRAASNEKRPTENGRNPRKREEDLDDSL